MPNNTETPKDRIDKLAKKALEELKKVTDAQHPASLDADLKKVKDNLDAIVMDHHNK